MIEGAGEANADPVGGRPVRERPARVAVWGLGNHARRRILPALGACQAIELVGVVTRDREVAATEAETHHCRVWSSPEEMLRSPEVDVVVLATPTGLHGLHGGQVLRAGKHLWCEKSLTVRPSEADELVALARASDLCLAEMFMYLYHPQFERVRALTAEQSTLGSPRSFYARFNMPKLESPGFRTSAPLGGGALLDLGAYPLSLVLALRSEEPLLVSSSVHTPEGTDVDESGHAVLRFPGGLMAYLEWGFGRGYVNELTCSATRGSLVADRVFSKTPEHIASVRVGDERGTFATETFVPTDAFVAMFSKLAEALSDAEFRASLLGGAERQSRWLGRVSRGAHD